MSASNATENDILEMICKGTDPSWRAGATGYWALFTGDPGESGSLAAGSATGLEGSNPQFTGLDGTTVRIDGTYSAGTRTIDALNGA